MSTALHVKTAVYEGPLELLLELIEKRKLLINDISLANVTDEYIARVNGMEQLPVGETAEFISLAATLLLIKSRSLLPGLALSDDETRDIKELEYRLALYQLLRDAGISIGRLSLPMLYEGAPPVPLPLFLPDASATVQSLRSAAQRLIDGFPTTLTLPKVAVKKIMSLEEMIERLAARVQSAIRMSFKDFAHSTGLGQAGIGKAERGEIVVGFLALLELVKQGIIRATQTSHFGDITLESDSVSTPKYE
ncbi:MAG: ScpA family protein [Patescibacteria group bacterium]